MKTFNTLKDLWEYCEYCPICKIKREIQLSISDFSGVKLTFSIDNYVLKIEHGITYTFKNQFIDNIIIKINLINNDYNFELNDKKCLIKNHLRDFYFTIYANCEKCESSINSSDIEFNNGKISNFNIDMESIYLIKEKDRFHLSIHYDLNKILITSLLLNNNEVVNGNHVIDITYIDFDFSDESKLVNKIKTLITFS